MIVDAIKDKVAIIGMGCCKFGENWNMSLNDMVTDAAYEAYADAGISPDDIQAGWVGCMMGIGGMTIATPLKLRNIPITRVENACATGMDALRNASMSVALGLYDVVLVVGVEKLKDSGLSGLPEFFGHPVYGQGFTAPGRWALGATKYFDINNISPEEGKKALAKISIKNHHNGTMSPKAHFQREVKMEQVLNAPIIAWPLGLFDCCPTTDGSAAAVICRADIASSFTDEYVLVKGFGLAMGPGLGKEDIDYKYDCLPETIAAGKQAYAASGIKNPRKELSCAQLHDCFTIAELLEYEALGFSEPGKALQDIEEGSYSLEGDLPVNSDGGLKAFGHPIGATGLRMCYDLYGQLLGRAGPRQIKNPTLGLAMAQGGHPGMLMPIVTILGSRD